MQLLLTVLTVPDSAAPGLLEHLRSLGASWSFVVPDAPPQKKRPTIPRSVVPDVQEAFAEIQAARNGGPPLLTMEEFWASLYAADDETDA